MKTRFSLALLILSLSLFAKEVPVDKAKVVAKNFLILNATTQLKSTSDIELTLVEAYAPGPLVSSIQKSSTAGESLLYIFSINKNEGFIIVSADDLAIPILAYSLENNFDPAHLPINYQKWIEGYKNQIRHIKTNPINVSKETENKWAQLMTGRSSGTAKSTSAVAPLLTTKWNQSPYVNDRCPYDAKANELTVSGCVATAMAQIMKFWSYPTKGSGYHTYSHQLYGSLSANFATTTYDWASMTDLVDAPNNAVATLMYHCGVSIDMNYGIADNGGSTAYVITDRSPVQHCAEYALRTYFSYDNSLKGIQRVNYATSTWIDLLKTELNEGRPIEYAGFGSGGGHAFVCDGYDNNDYFHFNWGWGGYYDGYFSIDALDPGGTGIGGGSGGYNSGHQALVGIKPPGTITNFDLAMYADLSISENPLFYGDPYTIHTDVGNFGTNTFSGDFSVAVFDNDYNFVEFTEVLESFTLGAGNHYTDGLEFSNPGSFNLLPGDYYAGLYFRPTDENWLAVSDGSFSNLMEFNVYYANDIELYSEFLLSEGSTIEQNQPFTVTVDILNNGSSTFVGEFALDLYNLSGDFEEEVQTIPGAELEPGFYYDDVEFTSTGLKVNPGTYLMALTHKADGDDWILTGSSNATNPIKVIVKALPLSPDIYEDNDDENNAHILMPNFSGNIASISTEGSNMHVGTDLDFYKFELESGYDYSISARVHDSYSSETEQIYTNDVVWTYLNNGEWSDLYDDVMPSAFVVPNGGEILFGVGPYYEGETGTYLLDIQITRTGATSSPSQEENMLKIYPNPARDLVHIESPGLVRRIQIYDATGKLVLNMETSSENVSTNISDLNQGVYFLHVSQEEFTTVHKIVKQ